MSEPYKGLNAALARNSGPSAEDVEALADAGPSLDLAALTEVIFGHVGPLTWTSRTEELPQVQLARAILASDWLAAHTAAAEARGAERERQQAARIIADQVKDCRRAGGGIYTADFIAGLAWANALIADQGGA